MTLVSDGDWSVSGLSCFFPG